MRTSRSLILVAGLASVAQTSLAQTLSWANTSGGPASTAGNWSPAAVPGAANALVWNLTNTYTTTFSASVPLSTSHTYKRGNVSLSFTSPHTTSSFVRIGDVSGDSAIARIISGSLHAGTGLTIGNASGAIGAFTVDGETALIDSTAAGSDFVIGNSGTGTMTISNGASANPFDDVIIGGTSTGNGTLNITGTGGLPLPAPSSSLDMPSAGQDVTVGSSGTGVLNVSAGARVECDEMFVGLNPGSNGTVTVSGTGGILNVPASVNIATTLHLGDNPSAGASGGSGTLTVNNGGQVTVTGTTRIGDSGGVGGGTLSISSGGVFRTTSLVAADAAGFLNIIGGELHIDGGSLQTRNDVLSLDGSSLTDSPVVILEHGASCTLSNSISPFETLICGNTNQGTFDVFTGSHLTVASGDVILGNLSGSRGQIQVVNPGSLVSLPTSRFMVIGDAGLGELFLQAEGHLASGSAQLGRASTGDGVASVTGGAIWDLTGVLAIGGTSTAAGGHGSVTIGGAGAELGGTINVTAATPTTTCVRVWDSADSLVISQGGRLNASGIVKITGGFTLDGGTIDSNELELFSAAPMLRGTIMGPLHVTLGNPILTGDLLITDGVNGSGLLNNLSTIEIGDHTLQVDSASVAPRTLGSCHLGPSGRVESNHFMFLPLGATLSGDGTVDVELTNGGAVISQGGGLTFSKVISGFGQGFSGTTLTFANGGGFTGAGTFPITMPIAAQSGSIITATGDLTMGSTSSTVGFSGPGGTIVVNGDFDVLLNDSNGANIGSVQFPTDAGTFPSVICSNGLTQSSVGRITGSGTLGGGVNAGMTLNGVIDPGTSVAAGQVDLRGEIVMNSSARLEFDILDADNHDQLHTVLLTSFSSPFDPPTFHPRNMTLNGTLVVRVAPAHTPAFGETHQLISAGGSIFNLGQINRLLGSFHSVILPPKWIYGLINGSAVPNGLYVVYCPADFNADNTADFFDYLDFVDAFSAGLPAADFNEDGVIDFFDYLDFVDAFSAGC